MMKKPFEDDDPMELTGVALPGGDMEEAAEALVEEFVRMGFDDAHLLHLFKSPFYTGTHQIYQQKGEEYVRALIKKIRLRWRVPRGNDPREPNE
jgi:DNA-binding LacI/PurR family transcriptional regulator